MKRVEPIDDAVGGMAPPSRAVFYILFSLAGGDKHGYAIMQESVSMSEGEFRMGPATLYTNIQRLLASGLIREVSNEQEARRRSYRLTRQGKSVLEQELERMRKVLRRAQRFSLAAKGAH